MKKLTASGLCLGIGATLLIVYFISQKPWQWGIEGRLQSTRDDIATQFRSHTDPALQSAHLRTDQIKLANILAALTLATPMSLDTPSLCAASYYPRYAPGQAMLVVYWLADRPRADAVRLVWEDGRTKDFPMLAAQVELNYYRLKAGRLESFVSYGLKSFAHDGVT
jgi:hypothetical protein